jgi:diadenosine tetraphosphate (Ap4A) HIT family hydrolase
VFTLDAQLEADTIFIADLELSQVRLLNDSRFPWLVLVPRVNNASELHELPVDVAQMLLGEIRCVAQLLTSVIACEKINIGALGNKVRQLHVHIIARTTTDVAWPGAVWDKGPAVPYADQNKQEMIEDVRRQLATQISAAAP